MASVRKAATAVVNVVSTAAHTVNNACVGLNNVTDVAVAYSSAYLDRVTQELAMEAHTIPDRAKAGAAQKLVEHLMDVESFKKRSSEHARLYEQALASIEANM